MSTETIEFKNTHPFQHSLFDGPPVIPESITGLARYKLEVGSYYKRLKSLSYLGFEIFGVLLLLGLIWITVEWVRVAVTVIAILFSVILLWLFSYILF